MEWSAPVCGKAVTAVEARPFNRGWPRGSGTDPFPLAAAVNGLPKLPKADAGNVTFRVVKYFHTHKRNLMRPYKRLDDIKNG